MHHWVETRLLHHSIRLNLLRGIARLWILLITLARHLRSLLVLAWSALVATSVTTSIASSASVRTSAVVLIVSTLVVAVAHTLLKRGSTWQHVLRIAVRRIRVCAIKHGVEELTDLL